MNKLSEKQQQFVDEYIKDKNATKAAIRAGYSEKTAYSQGQRLLKKAEIKVEIDKLFQQVRKTNIAQAQEVEEFLTIVMRGEVTEEVVCPDGMGGVFRQDKITSVTDRIKAATILAKRYGLDKPKVEIEDSNIKIDITDSEENED